MDDATTLAARDFQWFVQMQMKDIKKSSVLAHYNAPTLKVGVILVRRPSMLLSEAAF